MQNMDENNLGYELGLAWLYYIDTHGDKTTNDANDTYVGIISKFRKRLEKIVVEYPDNGAAVITVKKFAPPIIREHSEAQGTIPLEHKSMGIEHTAVIGYVSGHPRAPLSPDEFKGTTFFKRRQELSGEDKVSDLRPLIEDLVKTTEPEEMKFEIPKAQATPY